MTTSKAVRMMIRMTINQLEGEPARTGVSVSLVGGALRARVIQAAAASRWKV